MIILQCCNTEAGPSLNSLNCKAALFHNKLKTGAEEKICCAQKRSARKSKKTVTCLIIIIVIIKNINLA